MSQENVQVVRRLTQAFDQSGPAGFLQAFAAVATPDVEWREDPAWPGANTYHGVEEVRGLFKDHLESFDFVQEVEEIVAADEHVVAFVRWTGRAHSNDLETDMSVAIVHSFRDGRVSRVAFHFDRAEALEAVGLSDG